ncbi:MAG: PspC domain-containing protein [Bacteroidota bacterium]
MNKTVTANISGLVFHIEEEAYLTLSNYLNAIKAYLKNSDALSEIISDIEARIAELFQQKLKTSKQVIVAEDVAEVIEILGAPEVFREDDGSTTTNNSSDKKEQENEVHNENRVRRIFRNPDEKILGGVCSGIASYFNIDPLWIRLSLVASFFIFGFGFLLYLILWIIIPEAKTAAEKLEMKGEKVNLKNIEKTIKDEFDDLKKRYDNPDSKDKVKNGIQSFFAALGNIIQYFFLALSKLIGAAFTVIGIILLIALISSFLGINDSIHITSFGVESNYTISQFLDVIFVSSSHKLLAAVGLFLLIAVPLIMMIYGGIRIILKLKKKNKVVSIVSGLLWTTGLLICIYAAIILANNFKETATTKSVAYVNTYKQIVLKTTNLENAYYQTELDDDDIKELRENARNLFQFAQLDIVKNDSNRVEIAIIKIARGENRKESFERAKNINYNYTQTDSILTFEPRFSLNKEDKWRVQNLKIKIKIPVGQQILLEKGMEQILHDVDNLQNTWDGDMPNRRWVMTERGLNCVDCDNLTNLK